MQLLRMANAATFFASRKFWLVILPIVGSVAGLWTYFSLESVWSAALIAAGWVATLLLIKVDRVRANAKRREAAWNVYIERQIARAETKYIPNYWEQTNSLQSVETCSI